MTTIRSILTLGVLAMAGLLGCSQQGQRTDNAGEQKSDNAGAQAIGSPLVRDFVSGGDVQITLESGGYTLRSSSDNRIHVEWNEASGKRVNVSVTVNGKSADVKVENTPNNFHATILVPASTNLLIRMSAGDLNVADIQGNKDIDVKAGNVTVNVGKSSEWGQVDASVTAGDLHAPAFKSAEGGLFRSLHWSGPGKYRLRVTVTAGDVTLRS